MKHDNGIAALLMRLAGPAMFGLLFLPVAHLLSDHARVDAVASWWEDFLRDFSD